MSGEYEKRDTTITFRTTGRKEAWINDVARALEKDRSLIIDEIVTEWLENKERVRTPTYRTRELDDLRDKLKATIDAGFQRVLIPARGEGKRRTA